MPSIIFIIYFAIFYLPFHIDAQDRILVKIPTAAEETEYVWQTIQDIKFFEKHTYRVKLPEGKLIAELKQKAKLEELTNADYAELEIFFLDSIYKKSDYNAGIEKIKSRKHFINQLVNQIHPSKYDWKFKTYKQYSISLTLYGPGGRYNADEGSILMFTTPDGRFKNYNDPANTIIHEIIHIGIEHSIISKYKLPHTLKERIVDTFVALTFGPFLPAYNIQEMGEKRTDKYLKNPEDLRILDKIVEKVLKEN